MTKEKITQFVENYLPDEDHYIVDIIIKGKEQQKVIVLIDSDEGLNIDTCAKISRSLGADEDFDNLFDGPYRLEISSPGLDHPLKLERQYQKNIGRSVQVTLNDDKILEGSLSEVKEKSIIISPEPKIVKGRKVKSDLKEDTEIMFSDIKETKILITFK
ncbi:ribosome maturation factor RimP [Marinigracilibium pacificum]|uniref:Ribosome maturation factor RimP n=1 Tax=Marinigracilibium pacificum TaxID=2729599 RepID=A0A848J5S0_9BACT|nr:ribosome maturation factor RimP [Marinigracilibium pacificum]NMM49814.1 ribosome maturation factor RimP [Marinigracilibium pacificum]